MQKASQKRKTWNVIKINFVMSISEHYCKKLKIITDNICEIMFDVNPYVHQLVHL